MQLIFYPTVQWLKTHVKEIIGPVEKVSAGLDDPDEGNDEERHELKHGADLANPGGQVDVATLLPVEHLGHEAGLEGDHGHDQESNRENLETQFYTDYIKILSSKHMKFSVNENR